MTNFCLVDSNTDTVVAAKDMPGLTFNGVSGRIRVSMPDNSGRVIHAGSVGDEAAPYKIYEVLIATTGSGPMVDTKSDPVYDSGADTVTQTLGMIPRPVVSDADAYDDFQEHNDKLHKILRQLIKGINDGTFVPGGNLTSAQLKTFFKAGLGG